MQLLKVDGEQVNFDEDENFVEAQQLSTIYDVQEMSDAFQVFNHHVPTDGESGDYLGRDSTGRLFVVTAAEFAASWQLVEEEE
jgi:hypothetical protein